MNKEGKTELSTHNSFAALLNEDTNMERQEEGKLKNESVKNKDKATKQYLNTKEWVSHSFTRINNNDNTNEEEFENNIQLSTLTPRKEVDKQLT